MKRAGYLIGATQAGGLYIGCCIGLISTPGASPAARPRLVNGPCTPSFERMSLLTNTVDGLAAFGVVLGLTLI